MNNQLRPMALGEILDRTAELYRNHFLLFAGISAIFAGIMLAVQLLYVRSLVLLGYPNMMAHFQWGTASGAVLEALVILMLAGLSIAANNRAVAWVYLDKPASIRAAAKSVLPRLRTYLWLMTITGFRAWAPFAALYVAFFAVALAFLPHDFMTNPAAVQNSIHQNPGNLMEFGLGMLVLFAVFHIGCAVWHVDVAALFAGSAGMRCRRTAGHSRNQAQYPVEPWLPRAHLRSRPAGVRGTGVAGSAVWLSLDRASYKTPRPSAACGLVDDATGRRVRIEFFDRTHLLHRPHALLLRSAHSQRRLRY